LLNRKNYR